MTQLNLRSGAQRPFVDGNQRMVAVVSEAFLLNDYALDASDAKVVVAFVALAAGIAAKGSNDRESADGSEGEREQAELVAWLAERGGCGRGEAKLRRL